MKSLNEDSSLWGGSESGPLAKVVPECCWFISCCWFWYGAGAEAQTHKAT